MPSDLYSAQEENPNFVKIIGIIPARYRSSRFEGKALADILGKPMVCQKNRIGKELDFNLTQVAT